MSSTPLVAEASAKSVPVRPVRKIFSFPVVLSAFLAVLAVFTVRGRLNDPDMWWHLKLGESVWINHTILTADLFSFTALHHAYVPYEWLAQTMIYGAYRLSGYSGLMAWLCFFSAALLIAGYGLCCLHSGNAKVGFVGAMIVWFFATVGLAVRPQLIGYILLALELILLRIGRTRSARWFYFLPVLFAAWINFHASFFLGLLVLGIVLFSSFWDFQAGSLVCSLWEAGRRRTLLVSSALSVAATFLNPGGWKQVYYPLDTMLRQPIGLSQIQEWYPLVISDPRGLGLLGTLALVFLVLMFRRQEILYLEELLLLGVGAWMALSHQRMAIVFGLLAAPVVSRLLGNFWDGYDEEKDKPAINAAFLILASAVIFLAFPSRVALAKQVEDGSPVKAVEYIKAHQLQGNMLNAYDYGGYLIWALPEHPVFIDGRADLYEWSGVLTQFAKWATLQEDPNLLLDKYNVSFCLLERSSPVAQVLPLLPEWKEVYSDNASVIFVRSSVDNRAN